MKKKEIHTPEKSSERGRVIADHACCIPQEDLDRFGHCTFKEHGNQNEPLEPASAPASLFFQISSGKSQEKGCSALI